MHTCPHTHTHTHAHAHACTHAVALKSVEENEVPPQIQQMLLVLQGVHRTPPTDDYFNLIALLSYVVKPYQCLVPRLRNYPETESKLLGTSLALTFSQYISHSDTHTLSIFLSSRTHHTHFLSFYPSHTHSRPHTRHGREDFKVGDIVWKGQSLYHGSQCLTSQETTQFHHGCGGGLGGQPRGEPSH